MRAFLLFFVILILCATSNALSASKYIHVFVALCDNIHQGIVPVPEKIGNGKDPRLNLYWGAGYGVKSFFKNKTAEWHLIETIANPTTHVLERVVYKHDSKDAYLVADAFDGEQIKYCIEKFLLASNGREGDWIDIDGQQVGINGNADLIAYVGHDGLMEFDVAPSFQEPPPRQKDVVILACYSRNFFQPYIQQAGANPILWTTHLMAPEAYTLDSAITDWLHGATPSEIDENAAQTYNRYQKCGIKGARNLFCTDYK